MNKKQVVLVLLSPPLIPFLFCCQTVNSPFASLMVFLWEVMDKKKNLEKKRSAAAYCKLLMPPKYPAFTVIKTHPSSQLIQSIVPKKAATLIMQFPHY